jgi:hypothetical protein
MFDPDEVVHLFVDQAHCMLRGEPRTIAEINPAVIGPARKFAFPPMIGRCVLVVYGADPTYASGMGTAVGIGASAELEALETLFAASRFEIEYEVLGAPSRSAIVEMCRNVQPHILHFIGHAEAGAQPRDHRLKIYGPGGDPDGAGGPGTTCGRCLTFATTADAAASVGRAQRVPHGLPGGGARATVALFENIAESMLQRGTLGVIGMQGDIPGDVAAWFSKALYEALVKGEPVDLAVRQARWVASRIANRTNYVERRDWSFPMLRTRVMPELVLPAAHRGRAVRGSLGGPSGSWDTLRRVASSGRR